MDFFLDNGSAKVATEKNKSKGVEGEIVFLESQTHRIINLDESKVSTDGTSKLADRQPVTELSSSNTIIPTGVNTENKSGYSATFIGGSTIAGWLL